MLVDGNSPDRATNQKVARSSRAGRINGIKHLRAPIGARFAFTSTVTSTIMPVFALMSVEISIRNLFVAYCE
jgi:hypothetical protein